VEWLIEGVVILGATKLLIEGVRLGNSAADRVRRHLGPVAESVELRIEGVRLGNGAADRRHQHEVESSAASSSGR
jgi:hypothetical protein